jgi:pimeloyl-ACP methyl ester carboxylesterase
MADNMKLYHEVHGTGFPLVLIPGAFGSTATLGDLLPALAATRRVIAVDLQGHGRTPDVDRPIRAETMADDIADLLSDLNIDRADIMGYSLGGGVALHVASRHPGIVNKLVIVSRPYKRRGWSDETLARMDQMAHSNPENAPPLFAKIAESIQVDYDWTAAVKDIRAPTLVLFGSADGERAGHGQEFVGLLRDGRLEIVPGATHLTMFTPVIVPTVTAFLDAP